MTQTDLSVYNLKLSVLIFENIFKWFLLSCSSLGISHIPLLTLVQIDGLFYFVIVCIYVCVYTHTSKYNLLSLSVNCVSIFRADSLGLG